MLYSPEDADVFGIAQSRDDPCRVGILPARKSKGRARCPSHKTSKIIPQICNAIIPYSALPFDFAQGTQHSARAKRPASANSTQHSALRKALST
ncbi:hypothetical protein IQ243_21775 [Nostocales cyanobacterium LEGE 11386]|nr:hypothetical protein [Nostocales cyanobacterium LEGE 11386]